MLLGEQGARWALECLQQDAESQPAPGPAPKASTASQGWSLALPLYGVCFTPVSQPFPISAHLPELHGPCSSQELSAMGKDPGTSNIHPSTASLQELQGAAVT